MDKEHQYLSGFGCYFESEAELGILPKHQNSPQTVTKGLFAEQLSGSAFTAPRKNNLRTWLYRIRPSVMHGEFEPLKSGNIISRVSNIPTPPSQMRWNPFPAPEKDTTFLQGLTTMVVNGNPESFVGGAVHHYAFNTSMQSEFFYNADGELIFIPEQGKILIKTEFGELTVEPTEIAVIPSGVKFQVQISEPYVRGYVGENFGSPFNLPELGPIGANGLANPRDFQTPTAHFENTSGDFWLITKFQGNLWQARIHHSPFDVVGWHGNFAPYKYNLKHFNTINSVSFDHPDPSIFTVLTSPTNTPGVANIDFVIFPERWMVTDHTFRPPYYHRNIMSEYMGLIKGEYDAKPDGFIAGGASLHNCMQAHGPDRDAYEKATKSKLKPEYYENTLAFMFESSRVWHPTDFAQTSDLRQKDYLNCWQDIKPDDSWLN